MTDEEFLELVDGGVMALGPEVLERMKNVAVVIDDEPSTAQKAAFGIENGNQLFGLYEGVPLADRGFEEEVRLPDKITIFKQPILATYSDPEDIKKCVENTVWHEVAHHFGWDEAWVEAEEMKRGKLH